MSMGYQALYRVWRPQSFHDVVGQEHITKTLQNALLHEKFSHAYLFSGPRGTGKTSAAKIVAKAINCERAPVAEPCNECRACQGITDGSISDVIEIDAASNNGVDEIREIRDKVKYAPSVVRYKVYIIDEVHMLSTGAFNALLKTLEEPPKHVIFILATTEPHKIPATIISRCQRFDFKRISNQAIVSRLKYISEEQYLAVDQAALTMVAKASEGGMRDALSILDQVSAYSEEEITLDDVLEVTGAASQKHLSQMVEAIFNRDVVTAVQVVHDVINQGKSPNKFIEDLIYYYRDMLLYHTSPQLEDLVERMAIDDQFETLAGKAEAAHIYNVIKQLNDAQQDMKRTNHPQIFLEMSVVSLCQTEAPSGQASDQQLQVLKDKVSELALELEKLKSGQVKIEHQAEPNEQTKATTKSQASRGTKLKVPVMDMKQVLEKATKKDLHNIKSQWSDIMERLKKINIAAHAWLLESQPVASSNDAFLLAFKYEFHCQMVVENKNNISQIVEGLLQETFGKKLRMYPVPIQQWDELKKEFIKEQKQHEQEQNPNQQDPLISEAEKLVGKELLEIRD